MVTAGVIVGTMAFAPAAWIHYGALAGMILLGILLAFVAVAWFSARR